MPSPPVLILSGWQSRLPTTMTEADPGHHPLHPQESFAPYFWKHMIWPLLYGYSTESAQPGEYGFLPCPGLPHRFFSDALGPLLSCTSASWQWLLEWSLSPSQLPFLNEVLCWVASLFCSHWQLLLGVSQRLSHKTPPQKRQGLCTDCSSDTLSTLQFGEVLGILSIKIVR